MLRICSLKEHLSNELIWLPTTVRYPLLFLSVPVSPSMLKWASVNKGFSTTSVTPSGKISSLLWETFWRWCVADRNYSDVRGVGGGRDPQLIVLIFGLSFFIWIVRFCCLGSVVDISTTWPMIQLTPATFFFRRTRMIRKDLGSLSSFVLNCSIEASHSFRSLSL